MFGRMNVSKVITVRQALGMGIPVVLGRKGRPVLLWVRAVNPDYRAFRLASVQEMRDQKLHADLLRGA